MTLRSCLQNTVIKAVFSAWIVKLERPELGANLLGEVGSLKHYLELARAAQLVHINAGTVTLLPRWDLEYTKNNNTKHTQRSLQGSVFSSLEEGLVKVFPQGKKKS